jgi:outer membrane protein assembly factor BamE
MKQRLKSITILLSLTFLLGGCFVYKVDVQQGNEITPAMVNSLEIGMTKREVSRLLGFPLITDPFHKDRWDYFYSNKSGNTGEIQKHLASLKFTNEKLATVESSFE